MSELDVLPEGWVSTKLLDVSEIFMGQSPSASLINNEGKGLPFFQGKTEFTEVHPYVNKHCEYPSRIAEVNDLLMSVRAPVGPINIANRKCGFGRGLCAIRGCDGVDYKFLFYQLKLMEKYIASLGTGSTFSGINRDKLETLDILISPENEQTRIVEKLEELLSDLDNGVAELKAAQIKLTQYRQSLLKSAVEGSLTAEWRTKNQPTETGQQLLQRILEERRQRWEQQKLAEFKEKGKKPPKDWQLKYPEPVQPDTSELPELPEGWVWASVDQCVLETKGITDGPFGSSLKSSHYVSSGPRVIRLQNIGDGVFYDEKAHITDEHYQTLLKHSIESDDVVVAMMGEVLPRSCIIPDGVAPGIVKADCARIRVNKQLLSSYLLASFLNSPSTRQRTKSLIKGIGRPRINLGHIRALAIPIASQEEQRAIVDNLNSQFDETSNKALEIEVSLKQIDAQRKNILKDAFSGKLVAQDPNDEPASVLLEKIKAERLAQAKLPKPKRTKKKANNKASIMDTLFDVLKAKGDWMDAQEAFRACGVTDGGDFSDIVDKVELLYAELRKLEKEDKLIEIRRVGNYDQLKLRNGKVS